MLVGSDLFETLVEVHVGFRQLFEDSHHRVVVEDADVQVLVLLVVVKVQLEIVFI